VCVIIIIYSRVVVSQVTGTIVESTRTHTRARELTGRRSLIRPLKIHRHALYYCRRWRPSSFDKSVIIRRAHTHAKQTIIRPRAHTRDFANHRVLTYVHYLYRAHGTRSRVYDIYILYIMCLRTCRAVQTTGTTAPNPQIIIDFNNRNRHDVYFGTPVITAARRSSRLL